jgi:multidrug/hemolysin transport system ATP-binding protein
MRKQNDLTVLLTTHYMEEAAEADYVVIIDGGKCVAEGTPRQLKNAYSSDFITLYGDVEDKVKELGVKYEKLSDGVRIEVENTKAAAELILRHPDLFTDYEITKGKMDSVFLSVTGKKLGENR